jgi:ATP-binding cassette, subfamily B, bacterial PglK
MIKKVLGLLTIRERKRLYLLSAVMIISAVIEVVGIASIMPFLSLITNPEIIEDNIIINKIYSMFNFQSTDRFLIFTGVLVLVILVLSNLLVFLTNYGIARFAWMRNHFISKRLLKNYLSQPYKFYLDKNTSILTKNILSEVNVVVTGVIIPLLEVFSRGVVSLLIFAMLVIVEPVLAFSSLIILGGAYALTYRINKQRLKVKGESRYRSNAERYKAASEAFGDIKQLKLRGYENYFLNRYSEPSYEFAKDNSFVQVIKSLPKYMIEVIAFGGIVLIVLYFLITDRGLEVFLPIIGFYAFAIYRLLPAIQFIFSGAASIRFNREALDSLYEESAAFNEGKISQPMHRVKVEPLLFKKEFKLENITFNYPGTKKPVIKDLNLKIDVNTSIAFTGATGAGKTTIANIILGLLRPDSGKMVVDGVEITDNNLASWQRNLGYIPQDIYLQHDTVIRNITFGIPDDKIDMDLVINTAKIANIHDFIMEELPAKYNTIVGERGIKLSGGQRQRVGIARALYHNPAVLVLDEATSALDGATEQEVFKAIENIAKTKTLIIIAHRLTTIQNCDVIYVMENGRIVGVGKYNELMENNEVFKRIATVQ